MSTVDLEIYQSRALQLANAMKLCGDDMSAYSSAVALLAVHSAISYSDVLLIWLTGERSKAQDRTKAAKLARSACRKFKLEPAGISHLEKLLSAKTNISYGNQAVDEDRARALFAAAERFQTWVEKSITDKRVKR